MMRAARLLPVMIAALLLAGPARAEAGRDLDAARAALESGDAEQAISLLEGAPPSAEAHYLLGLGYQQRLDEVGLLRKRGVAKKLRQALERALELQPDHLGARQELADFFHYAPGIVGGSTAQRDRQIEQLREHHPAAAERLLARYAHEGEDYRTAITHLDAAISLDDTVASAWFQRGLAHQQLLEKDAAALADFRRARDLGIDDDRVYFYIGRLCVRLGVEPELAEASLREFIARSKPRNQAYGHYRLSTLREQQDRLEDALAEVETALRLRPDLEEAQAVRARLERKLSDSR